MVCLGSPWISSAPERPLSWQVHLQPPSLPSRCESSGQNSWVPRSWCSQSVFSSSSAEASRPRSSPVCARIHSCSLTVPASGLCQRPHGAPALLLTSQSSLSGVTTPWAPTAGWLGNPRDPQPGGEGQNLEPLKALARGLGRQALSS